MIPTFENAGRHSAASAGGVLFYNLPRAAAERRLRDAGFDPAILDTPVDGLTWRSTLTAAFAAEIEGLTAAVDALPAEAAAQVAAINGRLDTLAAQQGELAAEVAEDRRRAGTRAEVARLEAELQAKFGPLRAALPRHSDAEVNALLNNSDLAQRIRKLRSQL